MADVYRVKQVSTEIRRLQHDARRVRSVLVTIQKETLNANDADRNDEKDMSLNP